MALTSIKNILVLSFGVLILYIAYTGLMTLQSSLNHDESLGVTSLSVMYGSLTLSSMFLPAILMKKLGCKWTIAASMVCYIPFTLGNFNPSWPTMIPTSILLGIGSGPLWAAKSTYITAIGSKYAELTGKAAKDVVNQYFGIFFFICQTGRIWGNLVSSLILYNTPNADDSLDSLNHSICGAGHCTTDSLISENTKGPSPSKTLLYTLLGAYTGCGIIAIFFISIFLDKISSKNEEIVEENTQSVCSMFFATFKQLTDKRQCLLIPITIFIGLEQGFITGDYTRDYVTCAIGIRMVGFAIACFGVPNAICAALFGNLAEYTGHFFLLTLGALIHIGCIVGLLLWIPNAEEMFLYFVFPGVWGVADAVWQTQISSLYGILFEKNKEAAFANFCLWESVGFVIAFGYSSFLCVYMKLYILLCVVVLGIIMYAVVEYMEYVKIAVKEQPKRTHTPAA